MSITANLVRLECCASVSHCRQYPVYQTCQHWLCSGWPKLRLSALRTCWICQPLPCPLLPGPGENGAKRGVEGGLLSGSSSHVGACNSISWQRLSLTKPQGTPVQCTQGPPLHNAIHTGLHSTKDSFPNHTRHYSQGWFPVAYQITARSNLTTLWLQHRWETPC